MYKTVIVCEICKDEFEVNRFTNDLLYYELNFPGISSHCCSKCAKKLRALTSGRAFIHLESSVLLSASELEAYEKDVQEYIRLQEKLFSHLKVDDRG